MVYPPVTGMLLTCYAPLRRSPARYCYLPMPLDLHVLSLPLAFILSQDQTLHCIIVFLLFDRCNSLKFTILSIKEFTLCYCLSLILSMIVTPRFWRKGLQRYTTFFNCQTFLTKFFIFFRTFNKIAPRNNSEGDNFSKNFSEKTLFPIYF